ncbi:hypothetical protein RND71_006002 [Anisodus tanguticus]|uniref:Uncharacterized protein n=1 Tax=Anisodus tanguticus TaxID=243964 RepID=A0AAE1VVW1_9SOLA|nr:hypothetical protein RND71_006002 [Anisodus tanguticus]
MELELQEREDEGDNTKKGDNQNEEDDGTGEYKSQFGAEMDPLKKIIIPKSQKSEFQNNFSERIRLFETTPQFATRRSQNYPLHLLGDVAVDIILFTGFTKEIDTNPQSMEKSLNDNGIAKLNYM